MPMFALAEPEHSFASALPSTAVHALLIAAAVGASGAVEVTSGPPSDPISIDWPMRPTVHATVPDGVVPIPGAPVVVAPGQITIPVVEGLPPLPGQTVIDPTVLLPGTPGTVPCCPGPGTPGSAQVLSESEVDDPPSLLAAGPLRYPPVLREAGVTGSVTVSFVIDVEGRVEEQGIEVLAATHPGFVAAATETIRASRFRPARSHGATVRVRVRQTVTFRA